MMRTILKNNPNFLIQESKREGFDPFVELFSNRREGKKRKKETILQKMKSRKNTA